VVKGELCSNPYFTPKEELLSWLRGQVPKEVYGRVSADILKRANLTTIHSLEIRDARKSVRKISVLGGTVLDDVQSQVSIVDFYAELARESVKDKLTQEYLEKISQGCSSLQKRIDFMRAYQAIGESEFHWWELDDVLDSAGSELAKSGIEIRHKVGKLRIWADGLFGRAVKTLVESTPDLKGHGDVVSIRSSELRSGMVVSIEHEGKGLPDDVKTKIFECGFRHGCSDGFGLFLAGEILSSAGMTLRETGTPGKETRFEILVPRGKYQVE
jgi:signal transduction histidine kinase